MCINPAALLPCPVTSSLGSLDPGLDVPEFRPAALRPNLSVGLPLSETNPKIDSDATLDTILWFLFKGMTEPYCPKAFTAARQR
jgi:hypothetical protein